MSWADTKRWIATNIRLLSYLAGSILVTIWTLLRFFTQRTIFDLVGQQVVAEQWLHGTITGASIGTTNYIPKIFLLYMPLHVLPGSPRLKLIVLTVLVNVVTFMLIGLLAERILREFGVKVGGALYAALIWLAAIAGSVFWIQFTNSRNLEVAGGLLLLYQGLIYLKRPSRGRLVGIALFGAVLFFADTLQLYMTALPLLLYGVTLVRKKNELWRVGWLTGSVAAGFVGSKLLFALCTHLLSIHFITAGASSALSIHFLEQGIVGSAKAFVHLYSGGADAGRLREVCNILFLGLLAASLGYAAAHRLVSRKLLILVGYIVVIDIVVYIASGEAHQVGTERYLIMTAPVFVLLFGSLQKVWNQFRIYGIAAVCLLLAVNALFLGHALAQGSQQHFSQDSHLASVERYLHQSKDTLVYASMDTALPTAYLSGSDMTAPLPLSCGGTSLTKTTTFYAKAAYQKHEAVQHTTVAIILDGAAITNTPAICSKALIIAQLGQPISLDTTDDGSTVLVYSNSVQTKLHY